MTTTFRRAALAAALVLAGCAGSPTRYYSLAEPALATAPPAAAATAGFVEFAPVAMPERFARPQMVVRSLGAGSGPGVDVLEDHRWAASFEDELRDVLSAGVAARLGAVDATKSGRPAGQGGTRVAVQLRRFDAAAGRSVDAGFSWTARRSDATGAAAGRPDAPAVACQLDLSEAAGPGIEGVALAAQRAAATLADAIARSVKGLQAGATAPCGGA